MPKQIPIVNYLVLADEGPSLVARECADCGAIYFDRRSACARCGRREFGERRLGTRGAIRTFTIVYRAAPGVPTPFVSAVLDLEGGGVVKANLVGVEADAAAIELGAEVELTTFVAGTDDDGTEAIAFGFRPAHAQEEM